MPFSVEVHHSTELATPLWIFTRHVINILRGTCFDHRPAVAGAAFHGGDELHSLLRISAGAAEERLPAGGGDGVAETSEDEDEEDEYDAEE